MIEQDIDKKKYPTARAIEFINKESEEKVAVFAERDQLTVPYENSIVNLREGSANFDEEGIEYENRNKYRVIDVEYDYILVEYEESEDFEEGNQIIITASIYVESVSEE